MDEKNTMITIPPLSTLQHYASCPRQCALIHNEQAWAENFLTTQDRALRAQCACVGEKLGIHGVLDMVERDMQTGRLKPVEYKRGKPKPEPFDEIRLCAQALCLEEMTGQAIAEGALWYMQTRHRVPVVFSDGLRAETLHTIVQVRGLLESDATPSPEYGKRCKACSLIEVCQPKLMERDRSLVYVTGLFE